MDFFGAQDTSYDTTMLLKVFFDKTAFVKFKITKNFKQNIDETHSEQPKIHTSPWILKTQEKKTVNQKSQDFCQMFVISKKKSIRYTVRTVAADLRRGEHIPKMQNNIGRKSTLRVLRQQRSKDGGGGGCWMPYRAAPRGSARRWVLHSCLRFTLDRIRQRQKHHSGLEPFSFGTLICYSTNCTTLTLCKELVFKPKIFNGSLSDVHSVIY
jgi:hypothetical protein